MLKIVYPICCGMDVHKSFVVACIANTNGQGVTTYKSKRFSTFTGDLRRLAQWLADNDCRDACMESTGKYWIPVYNILEASCKIVLAHPKYVKAIRGKKTDKKDAQWIADIFKHDLVSGSFIPPIDIRQLRDLVRYCWKLTSFITGEKNRAQNCLTVSNIKLDDVFSDVFGKAASAITTRLLESNEPFDVTPFLTKGIKASVEEIQKAVDGEVCVEQAEKLRIIRSHMDSLELCKLNLESLIPLCCEKISAPAHLVSTVPGYPVLSPFLPIIGEIGGYGFFFFRHRSSFVPWAGLVLRTIRAEKRRPTRQIAEPVLTSTASGSVRQTQLSQARSIRKIRHRYLALKKRGGSQKGHHRYRQDAVNSCLQCLKKSEP